VKYSVQRNKERKISFHILMYQFKNLHFFRIPSI